MKKKKIIVFDKISIIEKTLFIILILTQIGFSFSGEKGMSNFIEPIDYVNPLMGSYSGRTYPGAGVPFGTIHWTPDTRSKSLRYPHPSQPYYYPDKKIYDFRGTHFPRGSCMHDYGHLNFMAVTDILKVLPEERACFFSHEKETAKPGYYSLLLDSYNVKVELTGTTHCGFVKLTFLRNCKGYIIFEADPQAGWIKDVPPSSFKILPEEKTVLCCATNNFNCYYYIQFERPFTSFGIWNKESVFEKRKKIEDIETCGVYVCFDVKENETILIRIGSSFINEKQAKINLEKEISDKNFETIFSEVSQMWNKYLGIIEVEGGTFEQKRTFYSCFYNTLFLPREFSEHGKYFSPFDYSLHECDFIYYTDYSCWDTFRAVHPLFNIILPSRQKDMIKTLISAYKEGGWIPRWPNPFYTNCMIGTHGDTIIIDSYVKGIRDFDFEKAYEGILKNATSEGGEEVRFQGRQGIKEYIKYGYVPVDGNTSEGTSKTLEFAYQDYCIAEFAKLLGKENDYKQFIERSKNYRNVFDREKGFVRGRKKDGTWYEPFELINKTGSEGFTESNRWQYNFFVPHDVLGLIELNGGAENFEKKLDKLFELNQYIHGNEPSHNFIYLYNFINKPYKTQEKILSIMNNCYNWTPDGLPGDDDCGQMSGWYVFNAMGFYPFCPGKPSYQLGIPLFEKITINLPDKKKFIIEVRNISEENKHVKSVFLNNKELSGTEISHFDIINGGTLIFEMGNL